MSALEEYVSGTLGLRARPGGELPQISALPRFITRDYALREVRIEGQAFVVATPAQGVKRGAASFKNHCGILENAFERPVILELGEIPSQQRRRLIEVQQSFVSPGSQLYVPELGVYLREKQRSLAGAALRPNVQLIFFYLLYHPKQGVTGPQFAMDLAVSRMAVSRAGQELERIGLIVRAAEGNMLRFRLLDPPRQAFEKARPYLRSPVKRRIALSGVTRQAPFSICAGLEALSSRSMLAAPSYAVRATSDPGYYVNAAEPVPDGPDTLELWTYNPAILAHNHIADPLSLALSIEDMDDPRVEGAVEEMLEDLWARGYE